VQRRLQAQARDVQGLTDADIIAICHQIRDRKYGSTIFAVSWSAVSTSPIVTEMSINVK